MEEEKKFTLAEVKQFEAQANTLIKEKNERIALLTMQLKNRNTVIMWSALLWLSILTMRIMQVL